MDKNIYIYIYLYIKTRFIYIYIYKLYIYIYIYKLSCVKCFLFFLFSFFLCCNEYVLICMNICKDYVFLLKTECNKGCRVIHIIVHLCKYRHKQSAENQFLSKYD